MNKVNFYFLSLNPCMVDFSMKKTKELSYVMKCYQKFVDNDARRGDVKIISFAPKNGTNYSDFVEAYTFKMKAPAVLVLNSIFDLSPDGAIAFSRLVYLLKMEKINTIYLLNFHRSRDVSQYMRYLNKVFRGLKDGYEIFEKTQMKPRSALCYDKIYEAAINLRSEDPPVAYDDIAYVLDMNASSLRSKLCSMDAQSFKKGARIEKEQKAYLKKVLNDLISSTINKYDILEEEYKD